MRMIFLIHFASRISFSFFWDSAKRLDKSDIASLKTSLDQTQKTIINNVNGIDNKIEETEVKVEKLHASVDNQIEAINNKITKINDKIAKYHS